MSKTLNLSKLAEYIGVNRRTLYRMILDGRFPVAHINNTKPRLWDIETVDNWRRNKK